MEDSIQQRMNDKEKWYADAANYWENQDPSIDGMLQGFEHVSVVDIKGSNQFITKLKAEKILTSDCHRAADFGAGIGRVSKLCLLKHFKVVDIVEQCENFTNNVLKYMNDESLASRVENIFTLGAQAFIPAQGHYDLIWMQWFVGHFTEDDFVSVLERCKEGLKPGGCIVIKDNIASKDAILDEDDSSVTRTHDQFMQIFEKAGLKLKKKKTQQGLPSSLFTVNMYALA